MLSRCTGIPAAARTEGKRTQHAKPHGVVLSLAAVGLWRALHASSASDSDMSTMREGQKARRLPVACVSGRGFHSGRRGRPRREARRPGRLYQPGSRLSSRTRRPRADDEGVRTAVTTRTPLVRCAWASSSATSAIWSAAAPVADDLRPVSIHTERSTMRSEHE